MRRLFPDPVEVERDYYRRTRIFPIMHTIVLRRDVYRANPWIAQSLTKAFDEAKRRVYANLYTTSALTTMLPWQVAQVEEVRREMGEDWWPYGLRRTSTCSTRSCAITTSRDSPSVACSREELFAPETLESFKI